MNSESVRKYLIHLLLPFIYIINTLQLFLVHNFKDGNISESGEYDLERDRHECPTTIK